MSVVRPEMKLDECTIVTKVVKLNAVVLEGAGVIFDSGTVDVAVANSNCMGIALSSVTGNADLRTVQVALLDGGVCPVLLSSTATEGLYGIVGTGGGFENQTIGGGTTVKYIAGQFMQSGVVGDRVGMRLGGFAAGCA